MQWLAIVIAFGGFALLLWLHPSERSARRFKALLKNRKPVADDELVRLFYAGQALPPEIPAVVRSIFARHMGYAAEKILPDDDLSFYWNDLDQAELVAAIETRFDIEISDADAETTRCSVRSVSQLVAKLRQKVAS